jgi:hypothetical protein
MMPARLTVSNDLFLFAVRRCIGVSFWLGQIEGREFLAWTDRREGLCPCPRFYRETIYHVPMAWLTTNHVLESMFNLRLERTGPGSREILFF